jgi:16S rRNA (cytosine967-C5)-methyltransferase
VAADRTGIDFQKLQIQPVAEDLPPWILSQIPSESWAIKLCEPAPVSVRMVGSENWNQIFNESRSQFPVPFQSSPLVPSCFRFERYLSVKALPPAIAKNAVIQDEGSQCLAAFALDPEAVHPEALRKSFTDPAGPEAFWTRPSWDFGPLKVVDACAGAGGKALAIADQMRAQGRIYAYDIAPKKIQALKLRARALDLHNIQAQVITPDAQEILGRFSKTADRVLVDAPCSGWGVLRRNPDLKWQDPDESAERLEKLQREILERMKELVRPGGILTFGVCTFRKQETLDVAQEFTARNPDFEWIRGGYLGPVPTDAFYMAAWRRKGQS